MQEFNFNEYIYGVDDLLFTKQKIEISEELFGRKRFKELIQISEEDLAKKERFLADYHSLRFITKESGTNEYYTTKIIVALSNLLRLCDYYDVEEIHLGSLRIVRIKQNNKKYFIITAF